MADLRGVLSLNEVFSLQRDSEWESTDNVWEYGPDLDPNKAYRVGDSPIQEGAFTGSDTVIDDYYGGYALAAGNNKVAVGVPLHNNRRGAVYVYDADGTNEIKITTTDSVRDPTQNFGYSVAIGSNKIVVGAPDYESDPNPGSIYTNQLGAVFIYDLDGTNEIKVLSPVGGPITEFGRSVAIDTVNNKIYVGAPYEIPSSQGAVYVYNLDGSLHQTIIASDVANFDHFGYQVAVGSGKLVVSSPDTDRVIANSSPTPGSTLFGVGSIYIYNLDGTGEIRVDCSDTGSIHAYRKFGSRLDVGDNKILVGTERETYFGDVFVYNLDGSGETKVGDSWYDTDSLTISGSKILFGYPRSDFITKNYAPGLTQDTGWYDNITRFKGNDIGRLYTYDLDVTNKKEIYPDMSALNQSYQDYTRFGSTVAVGNGKVYVGARGGRAYSSAPTGILGQVIIFNDRLLDDAYYPPVTELGGTLHPFTIPEETVIKNIRYTDSAEDNLGKSIAYGDGKIAIASKWGVRIYDERNHALFVAGENSKGEKIVDELPTFEISPSNATIIQAPAFSSGHFGCSVAIGNGKVVVGDKGYGNGSYSSLNEGGRIHIYNYDGSGHIELKTTNPAFTINGMFGFSVAIGNNKIAVGAPTQGDGNQVLDFRRGAVYVYNLDGTGETLITPSSTVLNSGLNSDNLYFGHAIAIKYNKIFITAPGYSYSSTEQNSGALLMYDLDGSNEVFRNSKWSGTGLDRSNRQMGCSIAVDGDDTDGHVIVGTPFSNYTTTGINNSSANGTLEIFDYNTTTGLESSADASFQYNGTVNLGLRFGANVAYHYDGNAVDPHRLCISSPDASEAWRGKIFDQGDTTLADDINLWSPFRQNDWLGDRAEGYAINPRPPADSLDVPNKNVGVSSDFYILGTPWSDFESGTFYLASHTERKLNLSVEPLL